MSVGSNNSKSLTRGSSTTGLLNKKARASSASFIASISVIVHRNETNCSKYFFTVLRAIPVVLLINLVPLPDAYSLNSCLILYISIGLLDIFTRVFAATSDYNPTKTFDSSSHFTGDHIAMAKGGQFEMAE